MSVLLIRQRCINEKQVMLTLLTSKGQNWVHKFETRIHVSYTIWDILMSVIEAEEHKDLYQQHVVKNLNWSLYLSPSYISQMALDTVSSYFNAF